MGRRGGIQSRSASSPAESVLRRRARVAAAVVAAAFMLGTLALIAVEGTRGDGDDHGVTVTSSTATVQTVGRPAVVTTSRVREIASPADDRSLLAQTLGTGAAPIVLQILLAGLAAFGAGALAQRVLLGEYGITLGPVSLPSLPPISAEATSEAIDLVADSPSFATILAPGPRRPQPFPQFHDIEDDRLALLSIRIELEERLRKVAEGAGLDRDAPVTALPQLLVQSSTIDEQAARGLSQLLEIGDRLAAGAEIEDDTAGQIRDQAWRVLYALGELEHRVRERRRT